MSANSYYVDFLSDSLNPGDVEKALSAIGFADGQRAFARLKRWAGDAVSRHTLAAVLPHLLTALESAALPDQVLVNIERLSHNMPDRLAWFRHLAEHPRTVETLVTLFSASQFLTEILLRHPDYVYRFNDPKALAEKKPLGKFIKSATALAVLSNEPELPLNQLRRWQRWELLRIGACDLLGLFDLQTVTQQLSYLAQSLIQAGVEFSAQATQTNSDNFVVIAMGKLGGMELNYSSDIDLLFLCDGPGSAYEPLGKRLIDTLTRMTSEGFLYRVDMRLRPWGRSGPLVSSVDSFASYLQESARLWEKQALLKARPVAGNLLLGERVLRQIQPLMFTRPAFQLRDAVRAMKERIERHLKSRGKAWGEVKLGEGSIRDVEVIAQFLQMSHGKHHPELLTPTTLEALRRLRQLGVLAQRDHRVLREGYAFLRTIEHHLQMMHHRQVHTLPSESEKLAQLSRRLGFQTGAGESQLLQRYREHSQAIREVYLRYLGQPNAEQDETVDNPTQAHLKRMHNTYAKVFSRREIEHHTNLTQSLDEGHPVQVFAVPQPDGSWQVTIVGYDYLGELSMICGLFTAYGLNTLSGHVFSYEPQWSHKPALLPAAPQPQEPSTEKEPSKIVDVFTVAPVQPGIDPNWDHYREDLTHLLRLIRSGQAQQAQARLVGQVAEAVSATRSDTLQLYPVEIGVDNEASRRYTVLHIESKDTLGFLYELTNALALNGLYIGRMEVETQGDRARDTLYVTDRQGHKLLSDKRQRELRVATVLVKHVTHLLPHSTNPVSALLHFRQFMEQFLSQPQWTSELESLEQPEVLDALVRLMGVSDFLWEDFLRMQHANLFPVLSDTHGLAKAHSKSQLAKSLNAALDEVKPSANVMAEALNRFKDREMFRIDMRHILGHIKTFDGFCEELTDLVEVVLGAALNLCLERLQADFGQPLLDDQTPCAFCLCALGKCGGRELGFASDIELMFLYAGNGATSGPQVIRSALLFEKVVEQFLGTIKSRREGIFELDLQLRPYGNAGSMAVSWEAFRQYYAPGGPAWPYERQALVRLRPIWGDEVFSSQIVKLRDALVYTNSDFDAAALRAMRERQVRHLVTGGTFNAKFSVGGLVDIEYLTQALQLIHGAEMPSVRQPNTGAALKALRDHEVLSQRQHRQLTQAHRFFRRLINALRMVRGNAKDLTVPPTQSEEFLFLARRLQLDAPDELARMLSRHAERVRLLCEALLPR